MKDWMRFPRSEGVFSKQAHADLPENTFEREFGSEGFFGPVSHIHHTHAPTGWTSWEGDLRPRAFDFSKIATPASSPWKSLHMLGNKSVRVRVWHLKGAMDHLVANGDGDTLLFVHAGSGDLFCDFGHMSFSDGDYLLLPRGLMWRVSAKKTATFLMIESLNESFRMPDRGMVGPNAVFDMAVLRTPQLNAAFEKQKNEKQTKLFIQRHGGVSTVTYPYNPLDAIGWHGDNLPVALNWRDIRPLMSHRYHLPPSAHTTFVGGRFVVCTFVPRPIESDPGALKVPFYHSNNDFDEIIFYHRGEFFSRDNIHPGMVTLHPCGFPHGPHPKAFEKGKTHARKETDEVAVMIDTRDAVEISKESEKREWKGYVDSWKVKKK